MGAFVFLTMAYLSRCETPVPSQTGLVFVARDWQLRLDRFQGVLFYKRQLHPGGWWAFASEPHWQCAVYRQRSAVCAPLGSDGEAGIVGMQTRLILESRQTTFWWESCDYHSINDDLLVGVHQRWAWRVQVAHCVVLCQWED